jgi:hypothetical protein
MRTTPIITIIRKYGLSSKRLSKKSRIKYEDAVNTILQYENSELKISEVLDNTRKASHNNCHCGLPGCGQRIRYEYILKSKVQESDSEIVAGSTCVWPTLGFSELQKKEFFKLDSVIRDHYALLDWKDNNKDVVEKLYQLKSNDISYYKAFWEEIETAPLLPEDTDYIRNVDVDKEIEKKQYREEYKTLSTDDYNKAVAYSDELKVYYKGNNFVESICAQIDDNHRLTAGQFRWLKVLINRMWFNKNIKGTNKDFSANCDQILESVFTNNNYKGTSDFEAIDAINAYIKNTKDITLTYAWYAYKCKNAIVH